MNPDGNCLLQGRLDLYLGPMFSGKSTTLFRKLSLLKEMGLNVLYINHGIDNRSDANYSTHSPLFKDHKLTISSLKTENLSEIPIDYLQTFDVIGIDESQFFGDELITIVEKLVDQYHKYVIISGLDGSYKRERLGHVLDLVPLADNVVKLHAYCKRCSKNNKTLKPALFTHYTGDSGNIIDVGGSDKYLAVCRECYLELNKSREKFK